MNKEQMIISEIYRQVEVLEDFIKICAADYKISIQEAKEILRLLGSIKEQTLK